MKNITSILLLLLYCGRFHALPTIAPETEEQENESSRKLLGQSVVTSVSVVMNGREPQFADASGRVVPRPMVPPQVASPINLLNPDRYEFYTFNDSGDLIKRLMTMKEIQSIVANGDGDGTMVMNNLPSAIQEDNPESKVQDIVNSVQNVLTQEMELTKNKNQTNMLFDTPDVSSSWSMILPAIFGNTGDQIIPPNHKPQQVVMTPDADLYEATESTKTTKRPPVKITKKPTTPYTEGFQDIVEDESSTLVYKKVSLITSPLLDDEENATTAAEFKENDLTTTPAPPPTTKTTVRTTTRKFVTKPAIKKVSTTPKTSGFATTKRRRKPKPRPTTTTTTARTTETVPTTTSYVDDYTTTTMTTTIEPKTEVPITIPSFEQIKIEIPSTRIPITSQVFTTTQSKTPTRTYTTIYSRPQAPTRIFLTTTPKTEAPTRVYLANQTKHEVPTIFFSTSHLRPDTPTRIFNTSTTKPEAPTRIYTTTPKTETSTRIYTTEQKTEVPTRIYTTSQKTEVPTRIYTTTPKTEVPKRIYTTTPKTEAPTRIYTTAQKTEVPTRIYTTTPKTETPTRIYTTTSNTEIPTRFYTTTSNTEVPTRFYTTKSNTEIPTRFYTTTPKNEASTRFYTSTSNTEIPTRFYSIPSKTEAPSRIFSTTSKTEEPTRIFTTTASKTEVPVRFSSLSQLKASTTSRPKTETPTRISIFRQPTTTTQILTTQEIPLETTVYTPITTNKYSVPTTIYIAPSTNFNPPQTTTDVPSTNYENDDDKFTSTVISNEVDFTTVTASSEDKTDDLSTINIETTTMPAETQSAINQIIESLQGLNLGGMFGMTDLPTTEVESDSTEITTTQKMEMKPIKDNVISSSNVFKNNLLYVDEEEPIISNLPTTTKTPDVTLQPLEQKMTTTTFPEYFTQNNGIVGMIDRIIEENKDNVQTVEVAKKPQPNVNSNNISMEEYLSQAATVASIMSNEASSTDLNNFDEEISFQTVLNQIFNEEKQHANVDKFNLLESLSLKNAQSSIESEVDSQEQDKPDNIEYQIVKVTSSVSSSSSSNTKPYESTTESFKTEETTLVDQIKETTFRPVTENEIESTKVPVVETTTFTSKLPASLLRVQAQLAEKQRLQALLTTTTFEPTLTTNLPMTTTQKLEESTYASSTISNDESTSTVKFEDSTTPEINFSKKETVTEKMEAKIDDASLEVNEAFTTTRSVNNDPGSSQTEEEDDEDDEEEDEEDEAEANLASDILGVFDSINNEMPSDLEEAAKIVEVEESLPIIGMNEIMKQVGGYLTDAIEDDYSSSEENKTQEEQNTSGEIENEEEVEDEEDFLTPQKIDITASTTFNGEIEENMKEELTTSLPATTREEPTDEQPIEKEATSTELNFEQSTTNEPETSSEALETNSEALETNSEAIESSSEAIETNSEAIETNSEAVETNSEASETNSEAIETNSEAIETSSDQTEEYTESFSTEEAFESSERDETSEPTTVIIEETTVPMIEIKSPTVSPTIKTLLEKVASGESIIHRKDDSQEYEADHKYIKLGETTHIPNLHASSTNEKDVTIKPFDHKKYFSNIRQQNPKIQPLKGSQFHKQNLIQRVPAPNVLVDLTPIKMSQGLLKSTENLNEDVKEFTQLCNEIAFNFYKATIESEEVSRTRSIVLSPFAASSMLAMIFLGARGGTSGEMNELLRLDDMVTFNPHLIFKNITESIEHAKHSGIVTAAFVRELFSDKSRGKLLQFYKEKAQQFYSGHVEEVNFNVVNDIIRRRTNLLVKRHTNGKIMEYLKSNNIWLNPPLGALSANIFQTDCSAATTNDRDGEMFFQVSPAVRQRRLVPIPAAVWRSGFLAGYDPEIDATAVSFGSIDNVVSTIFVMPGQQGHSIPGDSLERLENVMYNVKMSNGIWDKLLTTLIDRPGLEVQIPRFSHRSSINASVGLMNLGLKELFSSEKADLRGLTGSTSTDMHFSDMVQVNMFSTCSEDKIGDSHHIEMYPAPAFKRNFNYNRLGSSSDESLVNKSGRSREDEEREYDPIFDTEYSEIPLSLRPRQARLPDAPRLSFDRPFLYFVRHNPTGMILFMGRFNPRLLP